MTHPHSSNVLKVIQAFESVLPMAVLENHLDMFQSNINMCGHKCGTVHCHAGWFAIARGLHKNRKVTYSTGTEEMTLVLGFEHEFQLRQWALDNKDIWGNMCGNFIFSDKIAFESASRPHGALNLQHIIDHWKEVYERLKALEQPSNPYPLSASKDLAIKAMEETLEIDFPVKEIQN